MNKITLWVTGTLAALAVALFLTLLTTLFVSATPLYAAVITADGVNKDETQQDKQACILVSFEDYFSVEAQGIVNAQGGASTSLTAESDIARFVKRYNVKSAEYGAQQFSYEYGADFDVIVVSIPASSSEIAHVALFKDGCLTARGAVFTRDVPFLLADGDPA